MTTQQKPPLRKRDRRIRGHDCIPDGPAGAFGSVARWTCACGAAVLNAGNFDYGSALENDCPLADLIGASGTPDKVDL